MGSVKGEVQRGQAEQPDGTTGEAHPEIDAMLEAKSWFCPIREQQGDRAFYSPLADYIVVPLRSQFVDMQSFTKRFCMKWDIPRDTPPD